MPVKTVSIRNYKGIYSAQLDLGKKRTIIMGGNEVGKTSFLSAITAPFKGGYDPDDVRNGEAEGAGRIVIGEIPVDSKKLPDTKAVIEMVLDDGSKIKRVIDKAAKRSTCEWTSATGEKLGAQTEVEGLARANVINPTAFLRGDKKERSKIVMEFLNVPLDKKELSFIPGGDWWEIYLRDKSGEPRSCFDAIKAVEEACVLRRRDINRDKKELEGTEQTLRKGVLTLNDESTDWKALAEAAEKESREAQQAFEAAKNGVLAEAKEALKIEDVEFNTAKDEVDNWLAQQIQLVTEQARTKLAEKRVEHEAKRAEILKAEADALSDVNGEHVAIIEAANLKHHDAKANLQAYNEAAGLRAHLATVLAKYKEKNAESMRFDEALEKIDELRKEKMKEVPIEGISMVDGEVFYRGLALDALNSAQQTEVAAQIVTQLAGTERLIVLDDAEHLEPENRERFIEALLAADFQVVIAQVTEGPLRVEVE